MEKEERDMGTRYFIDVACPICDTEEEGVYYAPTCGFVKWVCPHCGHIVDLEELTGISYEDASNIDLIKEILVERYREERKDMPCTELKVIPWSEYCDGGEAKAVLLDLDTVPRRIRMDFAIRNKNLAVGKSLCSRCNGTGNELFSCYRRCQDCDGTGEKKE